MREAALARLRRGAQQEAPLPADLGKMLPSMSQKLPRLQKVSLGAETMMGRRAYIGLLASPKRKRFTTAGLSPSSPPGPAVSRARLMTKRTVTSLNLVVRASRR